MSEESKLRIFIITPRKSKEIYHVSTELTASLILATASLALTSDESPLLVTHVLPSSSEIYRTSHEERSIFWEVIISVILSKNCVFTCAVFRTVSEIELHGKAIPVQAMEALRAMRG
jgi:hypothetical protein